MSTKQKIVIAGGSGFLGKHLRNSLLNSGYDVIIISRHEGDVLWSDEIGLNNAINNSKIVINLAGRSVDCRYNKKNKKEILSSRVESTKAIGESILRCKNPPELWINSSSATIYRHAEDMPMTEAKGETGTGFSVEVVKTWEKTFFDFQLPFTRQAALRISIVLGRDGGVVPALKNLVRFGLGGHQGTGKQMFSWIHVDDFVGLVRFLIENKNLSGVFNCASPNPVTNKSLMKTMRKMMNVKIGLPSPKWLLELGAVFIRTETELVLKSRWVIPERLIQAGYQFKFPQIEEALRDLII